MQIAQNGCANMPSNRLVWTKSSLRIQRGFLGGRLVTGGFWQTEATKHCDMQIAQRLCQHAFKSTRADKRSSEDCQPRKITLDKLQGKGTSIFLKLSKKKEAPCVEEVICSNHRLISSCAQKCAGWGRLCIFNIKYIRQTCPSRSRRRHRHRASKQHNGNVARKKKGIKNMILLSLGNES